MPNPLSLPGEGQASLIPTQPTAYIAEQVRGPEAITAQQIAALNQSQQVTAGQLGSTQFDPLAGGQGTLQDLEFLRTQARQTGPSQLAQAQSQQVQALTADQLSNLGRSTNQQQAQAFSSLASSGGLGSGSRERIAERLAEQAAVQGQGVRRQGALSELGISAADALNRQKLQQLLPNLGLDVSRLDLDRQGKEKELEQFNIETALKGDLANQLADQFDIGTELDRRKANAANTLSADTSSASNLLTTNLANTEALNLALSEGSSQAAAIKLAEEAAAAHKASQNLQHEQALARMGITREQQIADQEKARTQRLADIAAQNEREDRIRAELRAQGLTDQANDRAFVQQKAEEERDLMLKLEREGRIENRVGGFIGNVLSGAGDTVSSDGFKSFFTGG